jgi:hypothetical protein
MRERIETGLEHFARVVARFRVIAIVLCLAIAGSLASQLHKIEVETAVETFLPKDDPARMAYTEFRRQFGREDIIILAIRPPAVFEAGFLRKLTEMHAELERRVPHIDDVQSLVNSRATYGSQDELIVEDLLEDFSYRPEAVAALRERVDATPLYRNTVISEAGDLTTIVLTMNLYSSVGSAPDDLDGFDDEFDDANETSASEPPMLTGAELAAALSEIRAVIDRYRADDFEIYMAGAPPMQNSVATTMANDLQRFVVAMIGTIMVVLFVMFRRLSGVLLPLMVVILALLSTVGALAASGTKLMPPTQVLPTFLLAVGIGAAVHILKIFYLRFDAGDSPVDAIAYAMRHSGLPVIMTALTTAGGLLSFMAAPLTPIRDLGIFAPFGIMMAVIYCLVLLPALLSWLPLRRKPQPESAAHAGFLERAIVAGGDYSVTHQWTMVGVVAVIVMFSISGMVRLGFSNDIMSWLSRDDPFVAATNLIDSELGGSITLELVADTGEVDGVKSAEFLKGLDELAERALKVNRGETLWVGKTISLPDVVKEIHKALNENRGDYYAIPDDDRLIAQELLLFENTGTDDLEDVVDTRFQLARFTLKVPYADPIRYDGFIEEVEDEFRSVFGDSASVETTGFMGMMSQTVNNVLRGMLRSYGLAIAIVTPLMILLIGNLRGGLVSMVPNLTPILLTLGIMGWLGITVDMFTMMIGSIAMGLAVDDTIHFIHGFRRDYAKLGEIRAAVRQTLETTGRALLVTSVVLSLGFAVFTLSNMTNLFFFGILTSFTIAMAFVIDVMITPALMALVTREPEAD